MELTSRLVRPFKRMHKEYADKINGFIVPVKDAVANLLGHVPNIKAFAGSEDLADEQANLVESEGAQTAGKVGLVARLKNFKKSLKEMSDFQKLILLTIAVVLPAGILISTILVGVFKKYKKK